MGKATNNLPDTPQDHFEYFHWLMLHGEPPNPKWSIGVQAAQLWIDYHEKENHDINILLEFVRVLMPHRYAGTGFFMLWQTVLTSLRNLPVIEQAPVWYAVFNPDNQGDHPVPHGEQIEAIIAQMNIVSLAISSDVSVDTLHPLVVAFGPTLKLATEWLVFANNITAWIKNYLPDYSFLTALAEQHNVYVKR